MPNDVNTPVPPQMDESAETPLPNALQPISPYESTAQEALTGLEGAASAATFGASTGLEEATGLTTPEAIQARREVNPSIYGAGQIAGLAGSALLAPEDLSAAGILKAAGEGAAEGLGLAGKGLAAKVGSQVVKNAVETALFQTGDEVSKMLSKDPNQTAETALTNIGLSGLLGGGVGGAFGLLGTAAKATSGKLANSLDAIKTRLNGGNIVSPTAAEALETVGIEPAPEIKAALSDDPRLKEFASTLEQSDTTKSGKEFQASMQGFRNAVGDSMVQALGEDPDIAANREPLSKYESGKAIGNALANEFDAGIKPLSEEYEAIKAHYGNIPLSATNTLPELSDRIGSLVQQQGWYVSPSSDIMQEINRVLKELPGQQTVEDLGNYYKAVGANMQSDPLNKPLYRAGSLVKKAISEAEYNAVSQALEKESGQDAAMRLAQVRQAYAQQAELKDALNDRLHIKGDDVAGYGDRIRGMAQTDGETLLNRMSGKNDADLLNLLQEKFPQTAQTLKQYHVNNILDQAVSRAKPGENFNSTVIRKLIKGMSPELRDFAIPGETQETIEAAGQLLDQINDRTHNWSNTGRTVDKLMRHIPGSALGLLTMLTGHSPITALLVEHLSPMLSKSIPDAAKLSLMKYLGSEGAVSGGGFQAMSRYISEAIKGQNNLTKAAKAIFDSGSVVLPTKLPDNSELHRLNDQAMEADPSKIDTSLGHYMPEHQTAMTATVANVLGYLNATRPMPFKPGPLNAIIEPSHQQIQAYQRTLMIAQSPLATLQFLKDGSLGPKDIKDLGAMYPAMLRSMRSKVGEAMINHMAGGSSVPFRMRRGLSLFMGQPMDFIHTPQGFGAIQSTFMPKIPPQMPQGRPRAQRGTSKLGQSAKVAQEPSQARQEALLKA